MCEQWLFSPKFRDSQPTGDALRVSPADALSLNFGEKSHYSHKKKPSNMLMTRIYYGNEMRKCQIMDVLSLSLSYKVIILSIDKLQTFLVLLL